MGTDVRTDPGVGKRLRLAALASQADVRVDCRYRMISNTNAWKRFSYTIWAPVYDLVISGLFERRRQRSIKLLDLKPGERVLLVGAGTGLDLDCLPGNVNIVATDLTPAMIARLKHRAERLGLSVDARVMDGHALDFPDESFDAVILHLIVAVIPDPVRCLHEVARVLRPSGRAVIFDKFAPDNTNPTFLLRLMNPLTSLFGTEITRRLGTILANVPLQITHQEAAGLKGLFKIVLVGKTPCSVVSGMCVHTL